MSRCQCHTDHPRCPVHPASLTCELCKREEATHWTIQQEYNMYNGHARRDGYYEAVPVCDDCTPRVASGDRPDDILAVTPIHLVANAPWL